MLLKKIAIIFLLLTIIYISDSYTQQTNSLSIQAPHTQIMNWKFSFIDTIKNDISFISIELLYHENGMPLPDDERHNKSEKLKPILNNCYLEFYFNDNNSNKFNSKKGEPKESKGNPLNPESYNYYKSVNFPIKISYQTDCEISGKIVKKPEYGQVDSIPCPCTIPPDTLYPVTIISIPKDSARIFLNDRDIYRYTTYCYTDNKERKIKIKLTKEGFRTFKNVYELKPNEMNEIECKLKKSYWPPVISGTVIVAIWTGCYFLIDNAPKKIPTAPNFPGH